MLTQGKRLIGLSIVALLLTAGICIFSWFHVRGTELKLSENLAEDCTVSVQGFFRITNSDWLMELETIMDS